MTTDTLAERYRVPKREVSVEICLAGGPPEPMELYVADAAERHAGRERPIDLLNGSQRFLAARDREGRLRLIARDAVVVATVPLEEAATGNGTGDRNGASPDVVMTTPVTIAFDEGTRIEGQVNYAMPEGRRRLKDFLNGADRFFGVRDGDAVHLVNRDRIVSVAPL